MPAAALEVIRHSVPAQVTCVSSGIAIPGPAAEAKATVDDKPEGTADRLLGREPLPYCLKPAPCYEIILLRIQCFIFIPEQLLFKLNYTILKFGNRHLGTVTTLSSVGFTMKLINITVGNTNGWIFLSLGILNRIVQVLLAAYTICK